MTARRENVREWLMVVAVATIVNVGYGTIFYSFGVLLGEGATAGEFGRGTLSAAFGAGVVVSAALALPVSAPASTVL